MTSLSPEPWLPLPNCATTAFANTSHLCDSSSRGVGLIRSRVSRACTVSASSWLHEAPQQAVGTDWKSDCLPGGFGRDYRPWPLHCPLTVEITARNLLLVEITVWPNKNVTVVCSCVPILQLCPACIWNLHVNWESALLTQFMEKQQRGPVRGISASLAWLKDN